MRTPVNPLPSSGHKVSSVAVAFTVDAYEAQPVNASAASVGRLDTASATLADDASQPVPRTMTVRIGRLPTWLRAGMWIRGTVGIQTVQPIIYRMPVLIVTDVSEDLSGLGGAVVTAKDPGEVLNGRPYVADTAITGTLRSVVAAACANALTQRTTDVSAVPAVPVPVGTMAEFGAGSWDACLKLGDALGYALRFTDDGDVTAVDRNASAPAPSAIVERRLTEGGTAHHVRTPTEARVLVTRGSDAVGLVGVAVWGDVMTEALPAWYLPLVITDRVEGDSTTTQAQANALAKQLLTARLSELDTYASMPILPAPWLEAGDVASFYGKAYTVRAVEFEFPSLATSVTLRAVEP